MLTQKVLSWRGGNPLLQRYPTTTGDAKRPGPLGVPALSTFDARRCPTLPGDYSPSTIGAGRFHFRVRKGNGWYPAAIATGQTGESLGTPSTP
jgi:hypothetical protein